MSVEIRENEKGHFELFVGGKKIGSFFTMAQAENEAEMYRSPQAQKLMAQPVASDAHLYR